MVFILVGVVDFGRLFMIRQTITNAAREGARIAILGDSSSTVTQKVQWYLQHAGLDTSKATISVSGTNNTTAQPVNVTVGYAAQSLVLKLVHAKSQISMTSTSAMLHE
jgi:Flp pilus assembly protein TadG